MSKDMVSEMTEETLTQEQDVSDAKYRLCRKKDGSIVLQMLVQKWVQSWTCYELEKQWVDLETAEETVKKS